MPRLNAREAPVLRACMDLMAMHGLRPERRNAGALRDATGRPVRFGTAGASDLHAVLPPTGRALFVETKRPNGGKLTEKQREYLEARRAQGAVAIVVSDVAVLERVLTRLRWMPTAKFDIWGAEA